MQVLCRSMVELRGISHIFLKIKNICRPDCLCGANSYTFRTIGPNIVVKGQCLPLGAPTNLGQRRARANQNASVMND